jgi:hypothetical protein
MIFRASPTFWVPLALFAAGLLVFYSYVLRRESRQGRRLRPGQWWAIWGLRVLVLLLAPLALVHPAFTYEHTERRMPVVPVLVDTSESMSFPDPDHPYVRDDPQRMTRHDAARKAFEKLRAKLTQTHRVKVYRFSDTLQMLRELPYREPPEQRAALLPTTQPAGGYSNIGDALVDALRDSAADRISGVLVLTDGRRTGGLDLQQAAEQAVGAAAPVHTVVFGTEYPLRDLRIDDVIVPAEASLDDVLTFHVKVTNDVRQSLGTVLTLAEEGSRHTHRRRIVLDRGQQIVPISLLAETEGNRTFHLSLPVQDGEVDRKNNRATVSVRIVKRTLRVLLIAGHPSREYYYMAPALLRDPIIDLSCYLQSGDVDYVHQGNTVIERLPRTLKQWERYDVAILFDVNPNRITVQQLAGLENMVRKGGGLVVVAGRAHGLAKLVQVHAARIRGLLPVEVDKNLHLDHNRQYERAFHIRRTAKGKGHPILLASTDPKLNEQVWGTFDELEFYWYHPIKAVKPRAIVLMERAGEGGSSDRTLTAIHRYEQGAVLFSAINSMWRWRFPYESYDYDRYWSRAIRYLGEARLMGTQQQVSLSTGRQTYNPGERVQIVLRVLDPALMAQLSDQPVYVSVTGAQDKDQHMVAMTPHESGEPYYVGTYRTRRIGTMVTQARQLPPRASSEAEPLFDIKHSFRVRTQSPEKIDTSADLEAMRALSKATGGVHINYETADELDALPEKIPTDPKQIRESRVMEYTHVWRGFVFLLLFLGLVVPEWCLRKWWGLL